DDAGRLVHHDHRPRADHGAGSGGGVLGDLEVEVLLGREPGGGCSPRDPHLELVAVANTPADLVEQLAPGDAMRQLVVAGAVDVTGQRDHERPGVLGVGEVLVPLGPVHDDVGQVGDRLDVVDDGRLAVEADGGGKV